MIPVIVRETTKSVLQFLSVWTLQEKTNLSLKLPEKLKNGGVSKMWQVSQQIASETKHHGWKHHQKTPNTKL